MKDEVQQGYEEAADTHFCVNFVNLSLYIYIHTYGDFVKVPQSIHIYLSIPSTADTDTHYPILLITLWIINYFIKKLEIIVVLTLSTD